MRIFSVRSSFTMGLRVVIIGVYLLLLHLPSSFSYLSTVESEFKVQTQ